MLSGPDIGDGVSQSFVANKRDLGTEMRLGIDGRSLNRQHIRGMGRYVWNLLTHFPTEALVEWVVFGDRSDLPLRIPELPNATADLFEIRGDRFRSWDQFGLPRHAVQQRVDVLHCTGTSLPWWQPVPTVVTLHDVIPWLDPREDSGFRSLDRFVLPKAFRKAAAIITVSESSRRDIVRLWPMLEPKLRVIPHGIEQAFLEVDDSQLAEELVKLGVRRPFLLYVGGEIPRKRFDWAMRVLSQIADSHVSLVVCGIPAAAALMFHQGLPGDLRDRVVFAPYVSTQAMPSLFYNAAAVLYPTLYEGFGFPALEAQAAGTPVLMNPLGSLVELAGPGAILLPPNDMDAWVRTCNQLLTEEQPRAAVNSAREWARRFSWKVSAAAHWEVYQDVAGRSGKNTFQSDVMRSEE